MSLKNTKNKTTSHSKYNINYHIIFCPKYRRNIFKVASNHLKLKPFHPPRQARGIFELFL
ncbi:transposase [Clostridiisalibacter paucivorans]|uniref:transposase n=1 Tax=Clostridiisalibacter paucivorans TaxID=408753 RepID=UPI003D65917A